MCGRYSISTKTVFNTSHLVSNTNQFREIENYNAYPTCVLPVLLYRDKKLLIEYLHWGLVPKWAEDREQFKPLNNARIETVEEKPSFRSLVKKYRCIIPADGYFEWKSTLNGKQPFYIKRKDNAPLYFGGLHQKNKDHEFTILTQESNSDLESIHHRMPLMLNEDQFNQFFDYDMSVGSLSREQSIELDYYPVSKQVNSPKVNKPELINRISVSF